MSNLTIPSYEALYNQSRLALADIDPYNLAATSMALIGLPAAVFTIFIILRTKRLRSSVHHVNVVHLTVACMIRAIAATVFNSRRIWLVANKGVDICAPWAGIWLNLLIYFGSYSQTFLHIALSASRVIGLLWPIWFFTVQPVRMQLLNVVFWVIATIVTLSRLSGVSDAPIIATCTEAMLYSPSATGLQKLNDATRYVEIGSLAIFVVVILIKRNDMSHDTGSATKRLIDIASRNSLIVMLLYVVIVGVPRFILPEIMKSASFVPAFATKVASYGGLPQLIEPFVYLLVFLVFDSWFRKAAKDIVTSCIVLTTRHRIVTPA